MLYINTGTVQTPVWTAIANATSHQISYSAETKERKTKSDASGLWNKKRVTKLGTSIKCDALCSHDSYSRKELLAAFKAAAEVLLKYGFSDETTGDDYEEGLFIIESLEETSAVGEDATFSASFGNSGEVETKTKTA